MSPDYKMKTIMIGTATPRVSPDTFTLTVPKADVSLFKSIAKKMGWKIERKRSAYSCL